MISLEDLLQCQIEIECRKFDRQADSTAHSEQSGRMNGWVDE